jgi:hypothetical protein
MINFDWIQEYENANQIVKDRIMRLFKLDDWIWERIESWKKMGWKGRIMRIQNGPLEGWIISRINRMKTQLRIEWEMQIRVNDLTFSFPDSIGEHVNEDSTLGECWSGLEFSACSEAMLQHPTWYLLIKLGYHGGIKGNYDQLQLVL